MSNDALRTADPCTLSAAVVNLNNIAKNYIRIKSVVGQNVSVSAVVKANAYGFGAVAVSRRLYKEGCRLFFVATISEGIEIRKVLPDNAKIFVLSGLLKNTEDILVNYKLIPVINNKEQSDLWTTYSKKLNKKLDAVLHVDTGMSRNGFLFSDEDALDLQNELNVLFIMSHLSCADISNHEQNTIQLQKFSSLLNKVGHCKGSLSATNGIFLGEKYHFDIVRPGKFLYGFSVNDLNTENLLPACDVFARVVQINSLKLGDSIGYGATFVAKSDMRTVTVGIGYADGIARCLDKNTFGFLNNKKLPFVGKISMDYTVMDASNLGNEELNLGDWVALTKYPDQTLEKIACSLNTIPHEVSCRLGHRVQRLYIGDE